MSWTLRLCLETRDHECSIFLTLTYADNALPEKLDYVDVQKFMRRLRKSSPNGVRFFCCGEYGKKTGRPHWHLMLYGVRPYRMGLCHIRQWPHGGVFIGGITAASAAYTARYSLKSGKRGDENIVNMSRRPGIGLRRIKEIGSYLATVQPEIDYVPSWLRYGSRIYPLDRSAYDNFTSGYTANGGVVLRTEKTPASYELEASIISIVGDPFSDNLAEFRMIKMDRKEFDNGSF